jgi:hypothetical protein
MSPLVSSLSSIRPSTKPANVVAWGERFTPTPIGSLTKRSKAAFISASPHTTSSTATDAAATSSTAHHAAAPSAAEHFELDASEIAKNLSMLNDLADVALATSRNAQ